MKVTLWNLLFARPWGWGEFLGDALFGGHASAARFLRTLCFFSAIFLMANRLKRLWGVEYWIGYPVGFVVVFLLAWAVLLGRILLLFPFPSCRHGKCHSIDDYTWNWGSLFGREAWGVYYYKCKCGHQYIREGKRFMEILSDGTKCPYKKLIGFRKWTDDTR
jgi:hypothetical protein